MHRYVYVYITRLSGASHPSSISTFNHCSIFQHYLFDKTKIKFLRITCFFGGFHKFTKIKKKLAPIGSADLTLIGYCKGL